MVSYWLLFFPFALRSLSNPKEKWNNTTFILIIIFLTFFIGLRYDVGTDSGNYIVLLTKVKNTPNSIFMKEYFFYLICKLSLFLNWGVTGVNFFSSIFFTTGLVSFCKSLPRPWLGLTISIPYLVIATGMGYTKQSISLGLILLGINLLSKGKIFKYTGLILIASLFHLTSLIGLILLLPFLLRSKDIFNRISIIIIMILGGLGIYFLFVKRFLYMYYYIYIKNEIVSSDGVFIRLAMIGLPALVFLLFSHRSKIDENQRIIFRSFAIYSITLVFLKAFLPSTLIDRFALYGLPILIFVGGNFHDYGITLISKKYISVFLVIISIATQFVWLNFAGNAYAWLPYQNAIIRYLQDKKYNENIYL